LRASSRSLERHHQLRASTSSAKSAVSRRRWWRRALATKTTIRSGTSWLQKRRSFAQARALAARWDCVLITLTPRLAAPPQSPPNRGYQRDLLHRRCRSYTKRTARGVCGSGWIASSVFSSPSILPDPQPSARKGSHADHRRVHDRLLNLRRADPRRSGVVDNSHVGDCAVSDIQVFSDVRLISHYQQTVRR